MNNLTKNTVKNSIENVVEFHNKRKPKNTPSANDKKPTKKVNLLLYYFKLKATLLTILKFSLKLKIQIIVMKKMMSCL